MHLPKRAYRNRVLAALSENELARLQPHLSPVTFEQEQTLLDGVAPHAYFIESGIASVVVTTERRKHRGSRHHRKRWRRGNPYPAGR